MKPFLQKQYVHIKIVIDFGNNNLQHFQDEIQRIDSTVSNQNLYQLTP